MGPHLGDMQNIVAADDSTAEVAVSNRGGGFLRGVGGLLDGDGASVVVHAGPDDYRSDPAGELRRANRVRRAALRSCALGGSSP